MTAVGDAELTNAKLVCLHPLHLRDEGEEWIVGRVDTGRFVALPPVGVRVIELIREGSSVASVTADISEEQGEQVDVAGFLVALTNLGFVAKIDGTPITVSAPTNSTFAWIRPAYVRWALHPSIWLGAALVTITAIATYLLVPGEPIRSSDLIWSDKGSLVLVSLAALGWTTVFIHELAHLVTARAAGVPGKITLGTRLQFLAAQTDVSGIWSAPRRTRIIVYLSGMAVNAVLAASGVFLTRLFPHSGVGTFGAVLCMEQLLLLAPQFMFFMRTDIYFLVQDLARCRDLYGDATAYVRYVARRSVSRPAHDPTLALTVRERRAVRLYSVFLVPGTILTLLVFVTVTVPVMGHLLDGSLRHLLMSDSVLTKLDALTVLAVFAMLYGIYAWAWWRRHGIQVRTMLRRSRAEIG